MALRCLIVDDNERFLDSASRLLESQGVRVVGCAVSGREAAELASRDRPDVILVDVQLGEEDGFGVARQLASDAPVVLISTQSRETLEELIAESPASGFVAKDELSAAALEALVG